MAHYRCHKAYVFKTILERILGTVEVSPKQFNMLQMSSTDVTFHAAQYLVYALQNPAPESSQVKLGNGHKEALKTLAEII